jgi:ABC-type spermidine/putrescine transport system permease subunit II
MQIPHVQRRTLFLRLSRLRIYTSRYYTPYHQVVLLILIYLPLFIIILRSLTPSSRADTLVYHVNLARYAQLLLHCLLPRWF